MKKTQHFRFKALGITSTKKPFNTHLWWEHSTYGILMVDSTNQAVLLFSTKARLLVDGSDWDIVDLSDNANSYKIQAGWLDGNDLWLVMCDNDGTADDFEVCFIEFDDSNDCNPIAVSAGADINTVYAYDIVKNGSDFFVINFEERAGTAYTVWWTVTANPFVELEKFLVTEGVGTIDQISFGIINGDFVFYLYEETGESMQMNRIDLTDGSGISYGAMLTDYEISSNRNFHSIAYDGSDLLYFVVEKTIGGTNHLCTLRISTQEDLVISEHNVVLMLDRNNLGTAPNENEKGFSTDSIETVYEITARGGKIRILQDCSDISDAVLIAITDNFLMNDDGDMFEFTDVTNEISGIRYKDGIIGVQKNGSFTAHPDFHINWNKKDSIKIYDDNDVLEFHGIINDKNRNRSGIYVFKIDSFTNEIYRNTYSKTYSADDTDTKQKDIIDNACDFCYRLSSIVGTTTNYNYVYNRAVVYLFWLARFLERQVPYVEPDGKIWTKAHDGLTATGKSWDINDNNQEVFLVDIPRLEERQEGLFDGNSGVTRNTVRYKNNASTIRPVAATRDPIEQLQGILPLNEFRDPKLEAATEANQLGDNRYAIWSIDTIFLGLRIQGEGYLQPGKTIEIQNTGEKTIVQDDFLILSFDRDPKNDVYIEMILSDNVIFPSEFNNLQDTTITQVHTASVQAIENQGGVSINVSDIATNTAYQTTQHNREITAAIPPMASHGFTAGAGNCYWLNGLLYWGTTGKLNGFVRFMFQLPSDYVVSENFTVYWNWAMDAGAGGADTVDFRITVYSMPDDAALALRQNTDSTKIGKNNNINNYESLTITGTDFTASENIQVIYYMEDDDNVHNCVLRNLFLIVPVNTRD